MDSSQSDSLSPTTNPTGFTGPNMNIKPNGSHHSRTSSHIFHTSSNNFKFGDHESNEYIHTSDTPTSGLKSEEHLGFVETAKAIVCDSVASNNKQLLLANLYNYFLENKNYRSAISLLKESELPILVPDKNTIKISISPSEQSNPSKDKKLIYRINHPEGEIELFGNEYLKSQSSIPSQGSFLLQWWECLWSLYNFVNTQPLELVTSIRPFIDVIQPIFSENNFNMPGMPNIKSPAPPFSQAFPSQSSPNGYPPAQPPVKPNSVGTQPKTPFGFDNIKAQQYNSSQRIPKETSSSSSPYPYSDNVPPSSLKPKYPYNENDIEYIKNAQDYASGGSINKYQNNSQFQKRVSKSYYPITNKNVTSATSTQFYSPGSSGAHHLQANLQSFNAVDLENSKNAMAANSGEFNSKPDGKFYPQDGVFRPVSNSNNNSISTNNNQNTSPLNDQATVSSEANMYQQNKRSVSMNIPIQSPHVPMMAQSITGQSPQVPMMPQSKSGQSPHVNINNHQYPVNQFVNIPQLYNQQSSFNNSNGNNVTQQPSKDNFNQNYTGTSLSQRSPYPQKPVNQPQAINKINSTMAPPQNNSSIPVVPNSVNSFNGTIGLNEQQQLMMQMQMQLQMKSGNFPSSLNGQQANQPFNGSSMQGIVPNMMPYMNNSQNNVNYKMAQYPTIPEGVRFNMADMQSMPNIKHPTTNASVNQNAGSSSSGDWGMGNNDNNSEPKTSSKRKKSKTISTPSNITTPTGSYPIYNNPSYQQTLLANGNLSNSVAFHSQNNANSAGKSMAVVKPKQQRGRKSKAGTKASIGEINYDSPYTPIESPLGSSDKQVKKNVTRKKRSKKPANTSNADTRKSSNSNIELMGHFAEATFLTTRASQANSASKGTNESESFVPTIIAGGHGHTANFVQKTNNINHKNDIVDSLMNGDDFGLKFLSGSTKGQEANLHGNDSAKYESAGNNLEDDDILLKSFLMDDDNFGGLDFNLDHNSADIDNS